MARSLAQERAFLRRYFVGQFVLDPDVRPCAGIESSLKFPIETILLSICQSYIPERHQVSRLVRREPRVTRVKATMTSNQAMIVPYRTRRSVLMARAMITCVIVVVSCLI
jgi:hypothetical protein